MKLWLKKCIVLVFGISLISQNIAYGDTLDDIRQVCGMLRSDNSRFNEKANDISQIYNEINSNNQEAEMIRSLDLKAKAKEVYDNQVEIELNSLNNVLKSMKDLEKIEGVFEKYEIYIKENETTKVSKAEYKNTVETEMKDNTYKEAYEHINNVISSKDDTNDYGEIGKYMKSIVDGREMEILIPYGDYTNELGEVINNYGLYLKIPEYIDCKILNILNGKIQEVVKDENGQYVVTIANGEYIKTVYWYLDSCNFSVGDNISQYDIIGNVNNGHNKVYIDISVDGQYINPLTLYQEKGEGLYDKYLETNSFNIINREQIIIQDINNRDIKKNSSIVDSKIDEKEVNNYTYQETDGTKNGVSKNLDLVPEDVREKEKENMEQLEKESAESNYKIDLNNESKTSDNQE